MTPLRLSLAGLSFPQARQLPGCAESAEASGNTVGFVPLQRTASLRLVPNLTLVGFSTTACPVDAQVGVGVVYATTIRQNLWLAASAGAMFYPTTTITPKSTRTEVRADLLWKSGSQTTLMLGVGLKGVAFGGTF